MTTTSGLTQEAFGRLLRLFHEDPQQAAEEYEQLRRVLIDFFRWRRCDGAEDLADEVFNRVAGQLDRGTRIHNPRAFVHGVARKVHLEVCGLQGQLVPLDGVPTPIDRHSDPETVIDRAAADREIERRLLYINECLQELQPESRALFLKYHQDHGGVRIEHRKRLAKELEISLNALRIRVCRIAEELAACVEQRLARASGPRNHSRSRSPQG